MEKLLIIGESTYGIGTRDRVCVDKRLAAKHNIFITKAKDKCPNLLTIPYHNHPKPHSHEIDDELLARFRAAITLGKYDFLRRFGVEPTLENVLAEATRGLSEEDLCNIPGCVAILLTDTYYPNRSFSHINAYLFGNFRLPVVPLEKEPKHVHDIFMESMESLRSAGIHSTGITEGSDDSAAKPEASIIINFEE